MVVDMSGHGCVERLTDMEHMAISYITRKSITLPAGSKLVPRHNRNPYQNFNKFTDQSYSTHSEKLMCYCILPSLSPTSHSPFLMLVWRQPKVRVGWIAFGPWLGLRPGGGDTELSKGVAWITCPRPGFRCPGWSTTCTGLSRSLELGHLVYSPRKHFFDRLHRVFATVDIHFTATCSTVPTRMRNPRQTSEHRH